MYFRIISLPTNKQIVHLYRESVSDIFIGKYEMNKSLKYLYNLFVVEDERNKGYGTELIKHAILHNKSFFLDTNDDNKSAMRLYDKCGLNKSIPYYNNKTGKYMFQYIHSRK